MKIYFCRNFPKKITLLVFLFSLISLKSDFLNAENLFEELQIENNSKTDQESSAIPTNPFELVEKLRRYNSLNDATTPSDAIDEALNSFNFLEEE